ncbi:hypothetical protein L596_000895 [Steinernema carpocapsae]|uniref:Uncharacterized protein n=1 Tax=Steinernema carpocapsae TaxID=34508 RepID=A0A4U8UKQ9_STECR|nr:hypothetical protein L596_000895 [Steinernema carpocapsae]
MSDSFLDSLCRDLCSKKQSRVKQRALLDLQSLAVTAQQIQNFGLIDILGRLKSDSVLWSLAVNLEEKFKTVVKSAPINKNEIREDIAMEKDMDIERPESADQILIYETVSAPASPDDSEFLLPPPGAPEFDMRFSPISPPSQDFVYNSYSHNLPYPALLSPQPDFTLLLSPPPPCPMIPPPPTPPMDNPRRYGRWESLEERIEEFLQEFPNIAAAMKLPPKKETGDSGFSSPASQ